MPPDLDIDRKLPLAGTMAAYHKHIVISTGRTDWTSRIEEDTLGVEGSVVRGLKEMLGSKGEYANPFHNVMITTSSSRPATSPHFAPSFSATLFPSFQQITRVPVTAETLSDFVRAFLLPDQLDPRAASASPKELAEKLVRQPESQRTFEKDGLVTEVRDITVLICGHGQRDCRCGVLGPILEQEFEEKLQKSSFPPRVMASSAGPQDAEGHSISSAISQISHIGGHKFAGNVILYVPRALAGEHPLAGMGIWYGRVEPKHVEGIVKKTLEEGIIIEELFRGGIGREGQILRLPK